MKIIAAITLATLVAFPAAAATLRPVATREGPTVRLSALFDDAGPIGAKAIGPSSPRSLPPSRGSSASTGGPDRRMTVPCSTVPAACCRGRR